MTGQLQVGDWFPFIENQVQRQRTHATVSEFSLASFNAVLNQTRDLNANAQYLVTNSLPNTASEHIEIVDPRGNRQVTTLDSRGRAIVCVEATVRK